MLLLGVPHLHHKKNVSSLEYADSAAAAQQLDDGFVGSSAHTKRATLLNRLAYCEIYEEAPHTRTLSSKRIKGKKSFFFYHRFET